MKLLWGFGAIRNTRIFLSLVFSIVFIESVCFFNPSEKAVVNDRGGCLFRFQFSVCFSPVGEKSLNDSSNRRDFLAVTNLLNDRPSSEISLLLGVLLKQPLDYLNTVSFLCAKHSFIDFDSK